jgi:DTW domain-containing protein YfiP
MTTETCPHCEKPLSLCICDSITPIDNRITVLILRHPQEQDRDLGTARIAKLQLTNSILKTGLSWPSLTKLMGKTTDPKRWGVLYLGTAKAATPLPIQPLTIVTRKGNPSEQQDELLANMEGIIVLDGNWAQAKALWWRNAWLLKCQRMVLQPAKPSLYGKLRKEPRRESVSSIEAIAETLAILDDNQELAQQILVPFRKLLEKAKTVKSS